MASPEQGGLWINLKRILSQLFKRRLEFKEADESLRKMKEAEARQKQDEEKRRSEEADRQREYRERASGEEWVEGLDAARQLKVEEVRQHFEEFIQAGAREGSGYLLDLARDDAKKAQIYNLIDASPTAANLIDALSTKGLELHGDPVALINLGRSLIYAADKVGPRSEALNTLLTALKQRVTDLVPSAIDEYNRQARRERMEVVKAPAFLADQINLKITDEQRRKLASEQWREGIDELFTQSPAHPLPADYDPSWVDIPDTPVPAGTAGPSKKLAQEVDEVWQAVDESEKSGNPLSVRQIEEIEKKLLVADSRSTPKDVYPGTAAYNARVDADREFVEKRLDLLAAKLTEKLKQETPDVKKGITDTAEFLEVIGRRPGYLGVYLAESPEMEKLLVGEVPYGDEKAKTRSVRFRNQVFLTIHSQILTDRNSSAGENFGLYERADFTTFQNIIRSRMAERMRPLTGISYGKTWVEWYANLSNTIRLSRDIDFWAAQPGAKIDDFAKSLALFQNHYSVQALSIPAVEQAYRAYETTLNSIKSANDGYIPPALIGYDPNQGISYWDTQAQLMLERMIKAGVVYDAQRDAGGFHLVDKDANTVLQGNKLVLEDMKKEDKQDLELSLYMTLAKGFGMASLRYIEMFANSRIPGSGQPGFNMDQFHSSPYEGVAMSLNYFSVMIHKWKFGAYRYLHMMNTLMPESDKIRHIDKDEPLKAYLAYRNGTFKDKDKYGPNAKRLMDYLNFSGFSSAFGPHYTKWRYMDVTVGWSDKQRELLGGPTQIMYQVPFADAKIKDFLVINKFRQEFRQELAKRSLPTSGPQFDRLWLERKKLPQIDDAIESEWRELNEKHKKEIKDLKDAYKRAFVARVWVEMTMRNPLAVANNLEVEVPDILGSNKIKKKIKLHNYLVKKILGIPLEELKYGDVTRYAAPFSSPTGDQRRLLAETMTLEADLAAVREKAIAENRELTKEDFKVISSEKNRNQALAYWEMLRKMMLGTDDPNVYNQLYGDFGLALSGNGQDYDFDRGKIENIKNTLENLGRSSSNIADVSGGNVLLNQALVDKDWEFIFGSDDVAYRQMAMLNLGARQWVRRGGDASAHFHGGERVGQYLTHDLVGRPDVQNLAKALDEVVKGYEGDMIEAGWRVAGLLAHGTARLYALDYKKLGSAAQIDVWHSRRNAAAWMANGRRGFYDALEHLGVLPPVRETALDAYDIPEWSDIHSLQKIDRAGDKDVWTEIILLGAALAIALTLYRALTAPSEEEEGGGGGGGGGHH